MGDVDSRDLLKAVSTSHCGDRPMRDRFFQKIIEAHKANDKKASTNCCIGKLLSKKKFGSNF